MAKFERTDEYMKKLFLIALDENHVKSDATVHIVRDGGKMKAYCVETGTYLQFPRSLRLPGKVFVADVIEVIRAEDVRKYYRAMPKSIRDEFNNVVG